MHYVCKQCGSDNLTKDATARWDHATEAWVLSDVFDDTFCNECDVECDVLEVNESIESKLSADAD